MDIKTFKAIDRHGAELEFELREAGILETNEAQMQYNIAFSKCLSYGILPRDKMIEEMKRHNIWNDDLSKELGDISKEIMMLEANLKKATSETAGLEIAGKIATKRSRLWEILNVQHAPLSNSCEGIAQVIKNEALMAFCVYVKVTGQRYWKTYKEYVEERDENTSSTVVLKTMEVQTTLMESIRKQLLDDQPEQKYVSSIKSKKRTKKK